MKNTTTNINRPEITSEEINAGKNFEAQLQLAKSVAKPFFRQKWFLANSFILVTAGIIAAVYFSNTNTDSIVQAPIVTEMVETEGLIANEIIAENNYVAPPIEGLNVPFTIYQVQNNKGKTITHKSGTVLKVPRNAFVDSNGNPVKGKVEIRYREFKDAAEIFASGIPMNYNQDGEEFHFASAGMVELLAYQNNEPVFLKLNKQIDVEMTSDYSGTDYNLYSLDTTNREWVYEGKDRVIIKEESSQGEVIDEPDYIIEPFAENDEPIEVLIEKDQELITIKKEIKVIQKDIKEIKKREPRQPQKRDTRRYKFDIDVDKKEFPEMIEYAGVQFEIGKENKHFKPSFYQKEWHDVSLAKNKEDKFVLTLKRYLSKKEMKTIDGEKDRKEAKMDVQNFIVYPVFEGNNYKEAMKEFNQKYEGYSQKLASRKEDERIQQEAYDKRMEELRAANAERQAKWRIANENRREIAQTSQQVFRAFAVKRLGTYNCDSPHRWPSGQTILASFLDNDNKKMDISMLYLIDKKKNAYFSFRYAKKLKFNPNTSNMLVGITTDNRLITFSQAQFKAIPKGVKKYDFKMKTQESNPENLKELKKCISYL